MSVKKPRFAVLLEDCENGQHGNLDYVSYFLADQFDPSLSRWTGEFLLSNEQSYSFSVVCPEAYPDAIPQVTFKQIPKHTYDIIFNGNTVSLYGSYSPSDT